MKWYWAVLLTLGIFVLLGALGVISPRPIPQSFYTMALATCAIWVAADSASFGWGMGVLLCWCIAFPIYLIHRPEVKAGSFRYYIDNSDKHLNREE